MVRVRDEYSGGNDYRPAVSNIELTKNQRSAGLSIDVSTVLADDEITLANDMVRARDDSP